MKDHQKALEVINSHAPGKLKEAIEEALAIARREGAESERVTIASCCADMEAERDSALARLKVAEEALLSIARYTGAGPYTEDRFDSVKAAALEAWKFATAEQLPPKCNSSGPSTVSPGACGGDGAGSNNSPQAPENTPAKSEPEHRCVKAQSNTLNIQDGIPGRRCISCGEHLPTRSDL